MFFSMDSEGVGGVNLFNEYNIGFNFLVPCFSFKRKTVILLHFFFFIRTLKFKEASMFLFFKASSNYLHFD